MGPGGLNFSAGVLKKYGPFQNTQDQLLFKKHVCFKITERGSQWEQGRYLLHSKY